jgi:hypothetical protein
MTSIIRWLIAVYAILAVIAAGYALVMGNIVRTGSEFSGLWLVILAMPWSLLFGRFRPQILSSSFNSAVVMMSVYIVLNMLILVAAGRILNRLARR